MLVSIIVPARNEAQSIAGCLQRLGRIVRDEHGVSCEIIVIDDASTDGTAEVVRAEMQRDPAIRLVTKTAPSGFGRAVRAGLDHVTGDVVVISMADASDDPEDIVQYVRKIEEGYDCVFGSRFVPGARLVHYPTGKRVLNRIANRAIQLLFWTSFNDLTNAFKAYRTQVIRECGPFSANDFDLTVEIALRVTTRRYRIAQVPVGWTERTAGRSKLKLLQMIPRYLAVVAFSLAYRLRDSRWVSFAFRVCVAAVIALATARAVAYLFYVIWYVSFPLEVHALEAVMVHHAWRVQTGSPLYPAWDSYPHVTNFFAPMYFWIVGGVGRATGASISNLFTIGRSVTFLSTLIATGCLGWYLRKRHGTQAAFVGALLSLGTAPLYGFSLMTRPDATADTAGLAGFLLTTLGTRKATIPGGALLIVAVLTKQTAAIYLLAAIVKCLVERQHRRALWLTASSALVLALVTLVLTASYAPFFLSSILQERRTPLSSAEWIRATGRLVELSPEMLIISLAGLAWWLRQHERGMFAAMATLLVGSLLTAFKVGADLNYFLPLRATSVLAVGTLWAAAHRSFRQHPGWVIAGTAGAVIVLIPSTLQAIGAARQARALSSYIYSPAAAPVLETYAALIRLVQTPNIRVLTDSTMLALYQKERAAFTDPWLFRLLVTTGRIQPRQMEQWLESGSYDFVVLTGDLNSRQYEDYDFGLPLQLVLKARTRYQQVSHAAGFFIYRPRPTS